MIILERDQAGKVTTTIKPDPTWEEIFAHIPTAANTEAEQQRHAELRKKEDMTESEEQEFNDLFSTIYPQFS